jgi:hypothetical protein
MRSVEPVQRAGVELPVSGRAAPRRLQQPRAFVVADRVRRNPGLPRHVSYRPARPVLHCRTHVTTVNLGVHSKVKRCAPVRFPRIKYHVRAAY